MIISNKKPLVSIIMMSYNHAHLISDSIESVLSQSYENLELIIIDDYSLDNIDQVVNKFKQLDDRIIFIKNEYNMGIAGTFNKALRKSQGKYVAPLNADDYWQANDKILKQVTFLERNSKYVMVGNFVENVNIDKMHYDFQNYYTNNEDIKKQILRSNQFSFPSVLIKADLLKKIGGKETEFPYAGDLLLWLKLGQFGKFKNFPSYWTGRRLTGVNIGETKRVAQVKEVIKIITRYRNQYPGYMKALLKYKFQVILFSLPVGIIKKIRQIRKL